ncbi:CRAL/TRIO domain-containing protein [Cryptosporidium felis]|nr:CRAL/TRIO domain-containing protein [Cryptosporidium felis]
MKPGNWSCTKVWEYELGKTRNSSGMSEGAIQISGKGLLRAGGDKIPMFLRNEKITRATGNDTDLRASGISRELGPANWNLESSSTSRALWDPEDFQKYMNSSPNIRSNGVGDITLMAQKNSREWECTLGFSKRNMGIMVLKRSVVHTLIFLWLFLRMAFGFARGRVDTKFKFGPLRSPHDRVIISDFDTYAIHYCGLKGPLFLVAHCIFHGLVDTLDSREINYEDYESVIRVVTQRKNIASPQKTISSLGSCDSLVVPYMPFEKNKGIKSIKGIKISSKVEDFCKFSLRCINNEPKTLITNAKSSMQDYTERWGNVCSENGGDFAFIFASMLDLQITKLKLKPIEHRKLCELGSRLSSVAPEKREALCMSTFNSEELCSSVSPYKLGFKGWIQPPIDPVKNTPFVFDSKTMIDEKIDNIVNVQVTAEIPPFCVPQEIFSHKPDPDLRGRILRKIHFYSPLSQTEKILVNQFLMHFVINYGKVPRVIFDYRSRLALEGWHMHRNKFPIVATHNAMYSLGRKLEYRDGMNRMIYKNSGSSSGTYPYDLAQFNIFSVYSDKTRNFEISDTNPLITSCLREGCAYFIGRSASLSPVLVIRASNIISIKNFKQSSASFISMFIMAFAEKYLFFPGKVESIDLIVDCRGFSLSNISTLLRIRPIILYWQEEGIINMYPLRFNNIFIIQSNEIWGTLKEVLGKFWLDETIKNVKVISNVPQNPKNNEDLKLLWRYMSPFIIETDLGGLRPKLGPGQFYPFKILPGPFKSFNPDILDPKVTPSASDWGKPDMNSPKNLYKLVPPILFSSRAKTLDGNEKPVFIDWKKESALLKALPKNFWPDFSDSGSDEGTKQDSHARDLGTPESKQESTDKKATSDGTAIEKGETTFESSDLVHREPPSESKDSSRVLDEKADTIENKKVLVQLFYVQKTLNNLRRLYFLRFERTKTRNSLARQCIQLASSHISFFSTLVSRALAELTRQVAKDRIGHGRIFLKKNSSTFKRLSILEMYIEILSTVRLGRVKSLLSSKLSKELNSLGARLTALEAGLEKAREEIGGSLGEGQEGSETTLQRVTETLAGGLSELEKLRKRLDATDTRERRVALRLNEVCEELLPSLEIVRSFLESYNRHDHTSMFESSLLLNMVDTMFKEQGKSLSDDKTLSR